MKKFNVYILLAALAVAATTLVAMKPSTDTIAFPEGYRTWTHVKTGLVGPNNPMSKFVGGFHHIYANDLAAKGYATGVFPQGSILVFDVLEAVGANGDFSEGKRRVLDIMVRDTVKYKSTGGWGYQEFKEDTKTPWLTEAIQQRCFTCHQQTKTNVISVMR